MELLGLMLFMTGFVTLLVGNLWFLIAAFRENVLWGLGCLLVPVVSFFFLIVHWKYAAKPFAVLCIGVILIVLGGVIYPERAVQ